jgi:ribosomal protein L22
MNDLSFSESSAELLEKIIQKAVADAIHNLKKNSTYVESAQPGTGFGNRD